MFTFGSDNLHTTFPNKVALGEGGEEKKRGGGNTVGLPYSDLDQNLEGTAFSNHDLFIINKKGVLINIFFKFETKFLLYIKFRK